jgi:hypothetical protein
VTAFADYPQLKTSPARQFVNSSIAVGMMPDLSGSCNKLATHPNRLVWTIADQTVYAPFEQPAHVGLLIHRPDVHFQAG